jgi:chromosome partitioning protein
MAVRKLLVASQKGGVGKTTTSINLAAATALAGARVLLVDADPLSNISSALNLPGHPRRQSLRQAGADVPGVLYQGIVPGLDVISPYEEGGCSDEDFNELLGLFSTATVEEGYGCLILDAPPFMGANPAQLLGVCDEYLLVMRAEAMAYRTLPAFLELVQRSRRAGHPITMRGILLTLAEGEGTGSRWERELRGRFGGRILPTVIPHDEEVARAGEQGLIVTHAAPDSPVAVQYRTLVENLDLAEKAGKTDRECESPLLTAAASLQTAGVSAAASSSFTLDLTPTHPDAEPETLDLLEAPPASAPEKDSEDLVTTREADDLVNTAPTFPPINAFPPDPTFPAVEAPEEPELFAPVDLPMPSLVVPLPPRAPSVRRESPTQPEPNPKTPAAAPSLSSEPSGSGFDLKQTWFIWIGLAVLSGLASRSMQLPDAFKPAAIGLAVAALVFLLVQIVTTLQQKGVPQGSPVGGGKPKAPIPRKQPANPAVSREETTRPINLVRMKRTAPKREDELHE